MATYKLYLRSFAPWNEFGALVDGRTIHVAVPSRPPMPYPRTAAIELAGHFHGDSRGFSLETQNAAVTARVNYWVAISLPDGTVESSRAWCDPSRGPWMGVGAQRTAVGTPKARHSVTRSGEGVKVTLEYGAPNPLVKGAPDIDARAQCLLTGVPGGLQIDTLLTGDQFPACEAFVEDGRGSKVFLAGFAPQNRGQVLRLYGHMNRPRKIWFQSHIVLATDPQGNFGNVRGGGSGTNQSAPASSSLGMSLAQWNAQIMKSIPMPADAR
jgi:hypothetical protein